MISVTGETPGIGHNNPPLSPFEIIEKEINDLFYEAGMWLDGATVTSQEHADGIANLLAMLRVATDKADALRRAEKAELDKQIAAIQTRYAPLIADTKTVTGKTILAAQACKAALQPWLDAESKRVAEEARIAREEAERQRVAAETALRASQADNLAERAAAEELLAAAKKAGAAANKAERATATAGGNFGRAIGLRTQYVVSIDNPVEAARFVWKEARHEMIEFLIGWAESRVRLGTRSIPGFEISEGKVAG
jgi:hypothetical protein